LYIHFRLIKKFHCDFLSLGACRAICLAFRLSLNKKAQP
jgi:hypothetical protein